VAAPLMKKVALTGGIGTGKSHVRARFAAKGVPTVDADTLVHRALGAGTPVTAAVVARFGREILAPNGAIDRHRLGAVIFADARLRAELEGVIHPVVFEAIADWFRILPEDRAPGWALADVPLLFETGRESWFDEVIVAACEPEEQIRRVVARDGITEAEAQARLSAQWPIRRKVEKAGYVVWTDRGFDETDRQIDAIYLALAALAPGSR
jgi:dephospho-CoA kinase